MLSSRWSGRRGRAAAGPPDPQAIALARAVLALLGPGERWAVYTVPGPRDLPDRAASQSRRDRWWRDHVAAVGTALRLTDPTAAPAVVGLAVEVVVACALARDRGVVDPSDVVSSRHWPGLRGQRIDPPVPGGVDDAGPTALAVLLEVVHALDPSVIEDVAPAPVPAPRSVPLAETAPDLAPG